MRVEASHCKCARVRATPQTSILMTLRRRPHRRWRRRWLRSPRVRMLYQAHVDTHKHRDTTSPPPLLNRRPSPIHTNSFRHTHTHTAAIQPSCILSHNGRHAQKPLAQEWRTFCAFAPYTVVVVVGVDETFHASRPTSPIYVEWPNAH